MEILPEKQPEKMYQKIMLSGISEGGTK